MGFSVVGGLVFPPAVGYVVAKYDFKLGKVLIKGFIYAITQLENKFNSYGYYQLWKEKDLQIPNLTFIKSLDSELTAP